MQESNQKPIFEADAELPSQFIVSSPSESESIFCPFRIAFAV